MGNSSNSKTSKETRKNLDELKIESINDTKNKISDFQTQTINSTGTDNALKVEIIKITEKCKDQLDRNDKPLTKTDYVGIITSLDIEYLKQIDDLNKLSIKDLISIIRTIIYDPEKILQNMNKNICEMTLTGCEESSENKKSYEKNNKSSENEKNIVSVNNDKSSENEKNIVSVKNNKSSENEMVSFKSNKSHGNSSLASKLLSIKK